MARLFVYPKKGDTFFVDLKQERVSVGRSEDNDLALPDPFSSGHHALIIPKNGGFALRDNGSKNGTFLNGKKIQGEVDLKKGDEILVGSTRLIYDKELSSNVELTEIISPSRNINTVIHLRDILKARDIETTMQSLATPADLMRIKSDYKSMAVLNEVSRALVLHQPLNDLLERIMELISTYMPMDRAVLMRKEGNPPQLIPKVIRINNKNLVRQKILVSQSIVNLVLDKHSSILTTDAQADDRFKMKDSVIKSNIHSAICVPLWNNKEIIGVIYADRISLLDQFSEDDLRLLTLLANLAAVKIENAEAVEMSIEQERIKKEVDLAAQIQKDFMPRQDPACENFDIAGINIPCYQVGGDYYDFISIDPSRLGIVIADVSGKGMGASLLMASLRAALHSEVNPHYRLQAMAAKLNNFVHRMTSPERFITFLFCELNLETGQLAYVNAGHNPPFIIEKNGKVSRLEVSGFCLGMFPSVEYETYKAALGVGDMAVLFTDGITEGRDKDNQEFGEESLVQVLKKSIKLPAAKIVEKVCHDLSTFAEGATPMDDMTMIVIKRTG